MSTVKYKTTKLYPNAMDPEDVAVAECDDNFTVSGEKLADYRFARNAFFATVFPLLNRLHLKTRRFGMQSALLLLHSCCKVAHQLECMQRRQTN